MADRARSGGAGAQRLRPSSSMIVTVAVPFLTGAPVAVIFTFNVSLASRERSPMMMTGTFWTVGVRPVRRSGVKVTVRVIGTMASRLPAVPAETVTVTVTAVRDGADNRTGTVATAIRSPSVTEASSTDTVMPVSATTV